MENSYPEVARFLTPQFYSSNIDEAIEEFKTDISKLYTYGMQYHQAQEYSPAKRAASYLQKKFKQKFPNYSRFINYVYTQDEKYNVLGKVYRFEYFELLRMYLFIKNLLSNSTRSRINRRSVLAFFYIIYSKTIVNDRTELNNEIDRIKRFSEHYDNQSEYLKFLCRYKYSVHFYPPRQLYSFIGVADSRTFENVAKLLGINYFFAKNKFDDKYVSSIWCSLPPKLKWAYQDFSEKKEFRFSELHQEVNQIFQSGFKLENDQQATITEYYEDKFIRNKENAYHLHLNGNPAIRLDESNGRFFVCVQEKFFDICMLMQSLYFKKENVNLTLKKFIKNKFDSRSTKDFQSQFKNINNQKLLTTISEITNITKTYPISSPIYSNNKHFKQIEKSRSIIKNLSNNGILLDITEAERLHRRYKKKNRSWQSQQEQQANSYEENDDTTIHVDDRHQTISQLKHQLEMYISRAKAIRAIDSGEGRIYGSFVPHGAKTHRMTCRNINLQGINKNIRNKVFKAPPGKILISKDVSGQDIAIAANLAMKLYSHPELFEEDIEQEFAGLREQMKETLQVLTSNDEKSNPIDFITREIIAKEFIGLEDLASESIRATVKEAVYTVFYGGGNTNFTNQGLSKKEFLNNLKYFRDKCIVFESAYHHHANLTLETAIAQRIRISKIEFLIQDAGKFLEDFDLEKFRQHLCPPSLNALLEDYYQLNDDLMNFVDIYVNRYCREKIILEMKNLVLKNYPGILESFKYYEQYYNEKNLTYPTFLGWQTEVILKLNVADKITKSKSYPIQASGAEFMREWLIELKRLNPIKNRQRIPIKIVNCIHDQVYVEIDDSDKTVVEYYIIRAAKKAAQKLGILEGTISLH